ncbi:UDP-N-acetyl-alpha-D-glucosamine C6 dehydratase [Thalassovita gelatinovora]|uniref:UDP-N-acetyl-alpha-D-glucosamine C6 dehydratase n=2 Tax=Thalassovita gelatinovora TaxID=53501 RepID=A0A0P1G000_THAGE|nr:polysaccharide biosynthesis protein [Thalassovita gelatinovora]CUH65040.1 UDP-N-acetyl-alpha-D-glucosamine C6 dehydratase [Thalassovita gelatinovora]SEP87567.1 NDP-sugar epimerase, includes UDP-GlcNAc-inverting 4,6-dehydratase FlaA1 and capsular polysaccharide biosynthesis protein EpsC [Thalassovita gelatinovora]
MFTQLNRLPRTRKSFMMLTLDAILICITFAGSHLIARAQWPNLPLLFAIAPYMLIMAATGIAMTAMIGLHRVRLIAFQMRSVAQSAAIAGSMAIFGAVMQMVPATPLTPLGNVIFAMSFLILSVATRQILLDVVTRAYRYGRKRQRILIYGAGRTGQQLAAALATDETVEPVCFVDDNPTVQSLTIYGLMVYSPVQLPDLIATQAIDRVVLAMPSVSQPELVRIERKVRDLGCEVQALPSFAELLENGGSTRNLSHRQLHGLMNRNRLEKELPGVSDTYQGQRILVTGAGGSIGSEICRQLLTCKPAALVLLDHSEFALYEIDKELTGLQSSIQITPVLGSVFHRPLLRHVLEYYKIDVVLHAAAYKHVPMVEANIVEGLCNNVMATRVLADEARRAGVGRFTLVSSDKAVRPTSVMGCTKRMAELIVQDFASRSQHTLFSMVRFGNVVNSSGSVVPLFQDQIAHGGPVTVTHPDVTRYFMTIPEAVRLVLLAGSIAKGGDVLVLDMGEPVKIDEMARHMIEGAGLSVKSDANPDGDIAITYTGLRPGEKLHEELLISRDMITTPHPKIMRAQEGRLSEIEMAQVIKDLTRVIEDHDIAAGLALLDRWIEGRGEISLAAGSGRD